MASFPNDKDGKIEYFEQRLPDWTANPEAVGLNAAQVGDFATLVLNARTNYTSAQQGKQETKNLVLTQDTSIDTMMGVGTSLLATIRAFADYTESTSGSDAAAEVFAGANISPYNSSNPTPPPAPATDLKADLLNSGGIKLSWKGTTANGTVYSVWRRTNNETSFTQIATSGKRSYEDQTVPAGSTEVNYYLTTIRDELVSDDSEWITVRLGVVENSSTNTSSGTGTGTGTELNIAA